MMNVALIGYGYWGRIIEKHIEQDDFFELRKIYTVSECQNVKCVDREREILLDDSIEAVFITTPLETHYELTKKYIMNGKHVFCEKPLSLNPNETRELEEISRKANRMIFVDYTFIFSMNFEGLIRYVKEIEPIVDITINFEQFGKFYPLSGVMEVLGPHSYSMLLSIINESIDIESYNVLKYDDNGNEAVVSIFMRNEEISIKVLNSLMSSRKRREVKLIGRNGSCDFVIGSTPVLVMHKNDGSKILEMSYDESNNIERALSKFKQSILEGDKSTFELCNRIANLSYEVSRKRKV